MRFAGFIEDDNILTKAAQELLSNGSSYGENGRFSTRLVLISEKEANQNWKDKILNILFREIIEFIVEKRNCWNDNEIASASIHTQWDLLINEIFEIANKSNLSPEKRKQEIEKLLKQTDFQLKKRRFFKNLKRKISKRLG